MLFRSGRPAVFPPGSRYITSSHRRAATGTHYTPRSLAEAVAEGALQPLVYRPGPLETSDTSQWRIRPSKQILELKVADIAMGSGAFLVAACRYLADHLIKAWLDEGDAEALAMDLHRTAGRVGADAEADQLLQKDSPVQSDLREALQQVTQTLQSLNALTDYLERHPESLIRGKVDKKGDPK